MESANDKELDQLLNEHFAGRVVRKDLTKLIKEGANVPVYVLEYLLGIYCASDDPEIIEQGLRNVKTVLAENYVRPDEAEKVKSLVRERGSYKVIDRVTVKLNERKDKYEASFSNLGIKDAEISAGIVKEYEKLLVGGIWVIATLSYYFDEGQSNSPFGVSLLKPIQMPNMNMDELFSGRAALSTDQWRESLIRSIGMEPASLKEDVQWQLLARMVPFVENNYNVCELGPRGTGKSHIYKECSPNSILVSGGQTTVANLFYNMSSRRIGLVGLWDVVAFDEVAGISFKDKDGVQIMKDYMASGSFARGREQMEASASMVFVGNINQSVESLVKTSHLLAPFPEAMIDSAFFDRFHAYIPGWEIPKMRPELEMKLLLKDERYANRSIGVISLLGPAQAEFIQSEALNEFGAGTLTQVQFACGDASAFQGAERDIIFLSMVADPQNCHALSRSDHEQRFNVAASRARERMYLVHSVSRDHISPKDLRLNLLNHFYDLQEDQKASFEAKLDLCESEFEKSVFTTLHEMGYTVTPQVKVGSYRIDLVVESDGDQRLAVECDGDSYHGPEQWHDDMTRQRALERAGWTFWRCFASSWFIERENMIMSLKEKLDAMGIKPTHGMSSLIQDVEHKVWVDDESEMSAENDIEKDLLIV
ncbi:protease Lon-related BREX system protein BrxL [Acinetobacter pittii]|nr:protease Lon-related BREX system protein BrxL [Acinetobacter pittii]MCK0922414.1 protease Lon-related BREX system protein BrxL [Acinetobacter pittii]